MYGFALRMYDQRLGRWHATDPYEQHWSPYLAMSNTPVSFVDPDGGWDDWYNRSSVTFFVDGLEVDAAEFRGYRGGSAIGDLLYDVQGGNFGGSWFGSITGNIISRAVEHWSQHIDPDEIFVDEWRFHGFINPEVLNGAPKENLYVLIRNKTDVKNYYINSKQEFETFNVIIDDNLADAAKQVTSLLGGNKLKTLVIDSHGVESGGDIVVVDYDNPDKSDLTLGGSWLKNYLTNKENAQKDIKQYPHLVAMENMMSFLDNDSKCVFLTCNLAKSDDGVVFMESIGRMVFPTPSQIYFNNDYSNPMNADTEKKELQIWQGKHGISKQYLTHGWVKVHVTGTSEYKLEILKGSNGRTGDIYLDNQKGSSTTVHEVVKKQ